MRADPFFLREPWRMRTGLLVSLLLHALLFCLSFGGQGLGLPGLDLPWRERRFEADVLRAVIAPAQVSSRSPAAEAEPASRSPEAPPVTAPPSAAHMPMASAAAQVTLPSLPAETTEPATPPSAAPAPLPAPNRGPVMTTPQPAEASVVVLPDTPPIRMPEIAPEQSNPIAETPIHSAGAVVQKQAEQAAQTLELAALERARREAEREAQRQAERLDAARQEALRQESARHETARLEAERLEAERHEREREEARRLEAERQEAARQAAVRQERERADAARLEAERQEAALRAEAEREKARLEQIRQEAARKELERQETARLESERLEAARLERERAETARLQAERQEAARQERLRQEQAQRERDEREAARQAAARQESERAEAARRDAERQEAARQEQARLQKAQQDAARAEQEAAREARLRAIGRQLDEEAARRDAASTATRPGPTLPLSLSTTRRARLFGRSDPNAELVLYAEAWARKIQMNTSIDTVREVTRKPHTAPVVTVALRSDGSVETVTFVLSSGVAEIDDAIRQIIQGQAPYARFSPALSRDYDVVEIRRSWVFDVAIRLQ